MADIVDRAKAAVSERAELPGMSLIEHLEELRRRIIHAVVALIIGFFVAYAFHERLYNIIQQPLDTLHIKLNYTHPIDPFNLYMKVAFVGGAILASPYVLYQVWLFISPGLYKQEQRYVVPFLGATVGLFLTGAFCGYHFVFPRALQFLIVQFGNRFNPVITIDDYTGFFMSVILGLGVTFELPILVFFLALFGIVNAGFLWKNIRYAVLIIFIVAAIITPTPDVLTMCVFATPMLVLYVISIGVAYMVHPSRRKKMEGTA